MCIRDRDLRERLVTRTLVDRAKGVLQARLGLDEAASYRWVQRTSMDRRMSMREVAELVLGDAELPRPPGQVTM